MSTETIDLAGSDSGSEEALTKGRDSEEKEKNKSFVVVIDDHEHRLSEAAPTGQDLLDLVHKKPCRYTLLLLVRPHGEQEIAPDQRVDLRNPGAERFRTAVKKQVTIFVTHEEQEIPVEVVPGDVPVATIKEKAGVPEGYTLFLVSGGAPSPLADEKVVPIKGCEEFITQVKGGGAS